MHGGEDLSSRFNSAALSAAPGSTGQPRPGSALSYDSAADFAVRAARVVLVSSANVALTAAFFKAVAVVHAKVIPMFPSLPMSLVGIIQISRFH